MGSKIKMNHYILCRRKSSTIPKISYIGIVAGQRKRFRCFARAADCIQVYIYTRIPQIVYNLVLILELAISQNISIIIL
jgi:hypothetical protein